MLGILNYVGFGFLGAPQVGMASHLGSHMAPPGGEGAKWAPKRSTPNAKFRNEMVEFGRLNFYILEIEQNTSERNITDRLKSNTTLIFF